MCLILFQSTLPRGERQGSRGQSDYSERHFNPRSHEGSDVIEPKGQTGRLISIHAPTRGATWIDRVYWPMVLDFNPRSHEGSDWWKSHILVDQKLISIHAPTRGATYQNHSLVNPFVFQSTLPRGERPNYESLYDPLQVFQSTLPRGERRLSLSGSRKIRYFNPRSHEGSDGVRSSVRIHFEISIHAPTRGATNLRRSAGLYKEISIHAPTRGATFYHWLRMTGQ